MLNLSRYIDDNIGNLPNYDTRSRITMNASDCGKSLRDIYWKIKGEPETNPTDKIGRKRMDFGSTLENTIVDWIKKLSYKGCQVIKQQARVGGCNPDWAGFVDLVTLEPGGEGKYETVITEIKTKWGWGAKFLLQDLDPSEDYLLQLGLYLKDYWDKKKKLYKGRLFYMLIPDQDQKTLLGAFVEFYCRFAPETGAVVCYGVEASPGLELPKFQEKRVSVVKQLDKFSSLYEYVVKDELPPLDYRYKYELTQEFLESKSDTDIKLAAQGYKILGDWQISYSQYKDKHLQLQNTDATYTPQEIELLVKEYIRRHPKQRTF